MRVKYVGPRTAVTGLYDGEVYEVSEIYEGVALRVVDEDQSDWNYDSRPDWLPGYLYSPKYPQGGGEYKGGKFYIVEDDENGSLAKLGVSPLSELKE